MCRKVIKKEEEKEGKKEEKGKKREGNPKFSLPHSPAGLLDTHCRWATIHTPRGLISAQAAEAEAEPHLFFTSGYSHWGDFDYFLPILQVIFSDGLVRTGDPSVVDESIKGASFVDHRFHCRLGSFRVSHASSEERPSNVGSDAFALGGSGLEVKGCDMKPVFC